MEIKHVFATIGEVELKDATMYVDRLASDYDEEKFPLIFDKDTHYKLLKSTIGNLCDSSFVPNIGDEIYVAPVCPIPTQDLRNNYKLKRSFDAGVCNVFSPLGYYDYSYQRCYTYALVNRDHKIVVMCLKSPSEGIASVRDRAYQYLPNELRNLSYVELIDDFALYVTKLNPSYRQLLLGTNKKPCIVYSSLKMNRNKLSVDLLHMIFNAGKKGNSKENLENFKLLLSTLQQCNWKEYPGCISLIFDILNTRIKSVASFCYAYKNQLPKALKELYIDNSFSEFSGDEDLRMATEFMEQMFHISDGRFASFDGLSSKLAKEGISMFHFNRVYKTTVKINTKI